MDLITDHDANNAARKLQMYSNGLVAECVRLTKTDKLQYWYCEYVGSYVKGTSTYFTVLQYYTSFRCTMSNYDSGLAQCRNAPRRKTDYCCSHAYGTKDQHLEPSPDDWLEPFLWHDLTGVLDPPFATLASTAYVQLVDNLPATVTNSIANVIEIASSLNDLLHKRKPSFDPRDIWLAYRYSYMTSKNDIEEYISLTKRLANIPKLTDITVHSSVTYKDVICRCTAVISCESIIPKDISDWLKTYGFRLNAVNAWDMIPYSFVVDWFLHISDFLEEVDKIGRANTLKPIEVWYSFTRVRDNVTTYFRIKGSQQYALPLIGVTRHKASDKTICYRIADTIALFTS